MKTSTSHFSFLLGAFLLVGCNSIQTAQAALTLEKETLEDTVTGLTYHTLRVPTSETGANNPLTTRPYFSQMGWSADSHTLIIGVPAQPLTGSGDTQGPVYTVDVTNTSSQAYYLDTMSFYGGHVDATISPNNNIFYIKRDLNYVYKRSLSSANKYRIGQYPASSYAWGLKASDSEANLSLNWRSNGYFQNLAVLTNPLQSNQYSEPTNLSSLPNFNVTTKLFPGPGNYKNLGHSTINPKYANVLLYGHEGPSEQILDRVWVYDPSQPIVANQDKNVFIQSSSNGITGDPCGHETWSRNGDNVYFVKYKNAYTQGQHGVYRVPRTGGSATLLNGSHEYWHVACSPKVESTGDWLVADTNIVQESPGVFTSKIVLIDARSAGTGTVRSKQLLKIRVLPNHPGHPHPSFSRDGKKISFGVVDDDGNLCVGWMDISNWINNGIDAPNPASANQN